jgi:hypothetical protein
MTPRPLKQLEPIRLVFELARPDNPRLYDDLIQFHKGAKRVNRLRLLAHDGLLAQNGVFGGIGRGSLDQTLAGGAQEGNGDVTNDLFAPSHQE